LGTREGAPNIAADEILYEFCISHLIDPGIRIAQFLLTNSLFVIGKNSTSHLLHLIKGKPTNKEEEERKKKELEKSKKV
jgi:hypothetical protein